MSYRKIEVNDNIYEYTIGQSHLKVKGFQAIPLSELGKPDDYKQPWSFTPADAAEVISQLIGEKI